MCKCCYHLITLLKWNARVGLCVYSWKLFALTGDKVNCIGELNLIGVVIQVVSVREDSNPQQQQIEDN